ncbi:hypothetical protein [Tenacibaculum halocynthiae]|uniref:hypothetical protein n=1 Tax=Tenacibaculum halocynthiae TaxID=1254437 RepID=UPI0038B517C9
MKPFPKNGNSIGVDKLVFDLPYSISLDNKLKLTNKILNVSDDTGTVNYSTGKLANNNNIEVRVYKNYIRFTLNPVMEIYGSNFYTLRKEELRNYLLELQEKSEINLFNGAIRRLDLQTTARMSHNPASYFEVLGKHKHLMKSTPFKDTLYYNSISKYKTLLFYNKSKKERKNKPIKFKDGEYLRYEAQYHNKFLKEIAKKLGKKTLTLQDLFDDKIYNKLIQYWYNDYKEIYKEQKTMFIPNNINKPSDIDKLLASEGIKSIGNVEETCKMIDAALADTNKNASFISKVKSRVKSIADNEKAIMETPFLEELESKITQAFKNTTNSFIKP